ncbi:CPBP family intramembrane glutamic endopeptidase [Pseudonocardia humida]|uniref:CPBP family intramembrane metalloprotease n=1 Tax=Pseudonocardia humida TaxID=2800819 RepID=A0ABT1AA37_9PSEU|nr:CPBP family intramembrane glutamic endopeptidase [Pseudonocardia humida]MCO1659878.1 CPBP family intramembrane metalloprotease [Pseudonocardia humida]
MTAPRTTPRSTAAACAPRPTPLSWPVVLALHLLPGAALVSVYAVGGPLLAAAGLPPVWALLGGVLVVLAPMEAGLLRVLRGRDRAAGRAVPALLSLGGLTRHGAIGAGVAVLAVALLLAGLALPVEDALRGLLDGVLPGWATAGPGDLAAHPPAVRVVTLVLWLLATVVVGPLVEEAWFRGYLQPRIPAAPLPSAVIGSLLFAAYHLWQPYAVPTVSAFALPIALLVARRGATAVGAAVHVVANAIAFGGLLAGLIVR